MENREYQHLYKCITKELNSYRTCLVSSRGLMSEKSRTLKEIQFFMRISTHVESHQHIEMIHDQIRYKALCLCVRWEMVTP